MSDITRAEICVTACADLFAGAGETLASPMGLIPSLGAKLARLTTEPDLLLSDGEAFLLTPESTVAAGCRTGRCSTSSRTAAGTS